MHLRRREILAGLGASGTALLLPVAAQAQTARRVFDLYRGKSKIGEQVMSVSRKGRNTSVSIDVDISLRILGLPAYRYRLSSREAWAGGSLRSLSAKCNDNGKAASVQAVAGASGLQVEGSAFQGIVPGKPGTTTYWTKAFLKRGTWISTQDGRPMNISTKFAGTSALRIPGGSAEARKYACRGDIGRLDLFYDQAGEWIGSEFDAKGQTARFVLREFGSAMAPLWATA